ncbi:MAG: HAMP domain-containing sensor histidine kinase [Myxococcales bacterium]|nr:HAMP domain-containing histidine kinase [Myxococcota bacterium]MDW8282195.1 HAMP domain-containing sensor histidine kinase [Myxococcales bacterium]
MRPFRALSPLYLSFPLVLVAALALARYSYRTSQLLSMRGEESLIESVRALGDQTRSRVDNFIIDTDRELFNLVDIEHLQDFGRRWMEIVRLSRAVEAAIVLDEKLQIVRGGYVSKSQKPEAEAFQRLFQQRILPMLPLSELRPDFHRHLHTHIDGVDYLLSYIKRFDAERDRTYYIILKINLEYLKQTFLPELLSPIAGRVQLGVIGSTGEMLYGTRIYGAGKFLYENSFPTTVYLWRLQVAPLESSRLRASARSREVSDTILIGMMLGVIIIGSAFLLYGISTEYRANQLKSEFISNVSHELKTPLSIIRMFGELLMLGKVKSAEKGREYAEIITRESERLSRLIDNVLDFSRIERGKAAYDMKPGDLGEVVERALDFYRYRLEREGRLLEVDVASDLPAVLLDDNAMTLLLLNLVDNALKYGGDGPITVRLRRSPDGRELLLSVADRGPGIPRDEQRKIFERFYRARAVRKKNVRGSGIGLALVQHIAVAHGGSVSVESEPGRGATFTVALPVRPVPPGEMPGEMEEALVPAAGGGHV